MIGIVASVNITVGPQSCSVTPHFLRTTALRSLHQREWTAFGNQWWTVPVFVQDVLTVQVDCCNLKSLVAPPLDSGTEWHTVSRKTSVWLTLRAPCTVRMMLYEYWPDRKCFVNANLELSIVGWCAIDWWKTMYQWRLNYKQFINTGEFPPKIWKWFASWRGHPRLHINLLSRRWIFDEEDNPITAWWMCELHSGITRGLLLRRSL
jgi:hypothetical protein